MAWALLPVLLLGVSMMYLALAGVTKDGTRAAMATILFVLFQSESIVRADTESKLSPFAHFALLQPVIPLTRMCLWANMSARVKAVLPVVFNVGTLLTLVCVYVIHNSINRIRPFRPFPRRARYGRAMVGVLLAGYGAFAGSVIRILSVIVVDGYDGGDDSSQWYQALTGDRWINSVDQRVAAVWLVISILPAPAWVVYGMRCLRKGTMRAEVFGLGVVLPLPVFLARWGMSRGSRAHASSLTDDVKRNASAMYNTLSAPYRPEYWYWDAVLLFQRQVYGLLALFFRWNLVARTVAMTAFSIAMYFIHVHTRPFCSHQANYIESLTLSALLMVCTSTTVSAYRFEVGVETNRYINTLHTLGTACMSGVVCASLAVVLLHPRLRRRWASSGAMPKSSSNMVRQLSLPLLDGAGLSPRE